MRSGALRLCGSIPQALTRQPALSHLDVHSNKLSGTLSPIESPLTWWLIHENKLTGSLPDSRLPASLACLLCSGNMLEGTLPGVVITSNMKIIDVSGKAGQMRGLRGQLPTKVSHALGLRHVMVSHQHLEGVIPPLTATLSSLAMQSNRLTLLQSAQWMNDSSAIVLMHVNLLSCSPPGCGDVGTNFSLVALGNRMKSSKGTVPKWVSPMERDGTFWTSGTEGRSLLLKVFSSGSLLGMIVLIKLRNGSLLKAWSGWHIGANVHLQLASASSVLLIRIAHQVLLQVLILMLLLSWDVYQCPPALSMASACLRNGTFNHLLVLVSWSQFCFRAHKLDHFTPVGSSVARESFTNPRRVGFLPLTLACFLACFLSSMSILHQAN